jgi:hypothetical protein
MKTEMQTDNSNERHHRNEGIISKSLNHEYKNFHNIQEIGKGSFSSIVYRANLKDSGEYVALKSFFNLDVAIEKEIINEVIAEYTIQFSLFDIKSYLQFSSNFNVK